MKRHRQLSVFIGEQLTKVLAELEGVTAGKLSPEEKQI
jgi:glutamine synthetase